MTDGHVTDAHNGVLYYSYSVRGVFSATCAGRFRSTPPPAAPAMLGQLGEICKFLTGNPANSIVFSEEWSGFRQR